LGDFAGGGMLCAMGILLALVERNRSGKGQIVDAAMVDGAANISGMFYGLLANRLMTLDIGTNLLDNGAHFYETYETADGEFISVGAIEERFYKELLEGLGLDPSTLPHQYDMSRWPEMKSRFTELFKAKTRDQWAAVFEGKDACVAPVMGLDEVENHPHNRARDLLLELEGITQPAPAPRLSRTPGKVERPARPRGAETRDLLEELGYAAEEIETFLKMGIVE
jgi:alpha-methylacyl-CoA racemase